MTAQYILVTGLITKFLDMEFMSGKMVGVTKEIGLITVCMDKENMPGLMAVNMLVVMFKIKKKDKGNTFG